MLLLCDYYAAVIAVAVVEVRADLVERPAALGLLLLDLRPGSTTLSTTLRLHLRNRF